MTNQQGRQGRGLAGLPSGKVKMEGDGWRTVEPWLHVLSVSPTCWCYVYAKLPAEAWYPQGPMLHQEQAGAQQPWASMHLQSA